MQLIDDEMEDVRRILLEPLPRLIENLRLDAAHQHDVQHRVVRDHDVRGVVLHIPARPHLTAVHGREEPCRRGSCNELGVSMRISQLGAQPAGRCRRTAPRHRRSPCVAPKVDPIRCTVRLEPRSGTRAIKGVTQTRELVLDERVERVEDERPDRGRPVLMRSLRKAGIPAPPASLHGPVIPPVPLRGSQPGRRPGHRLPSEFGGNRKQKALGLARPGSRCHHDIVAVDDRLLEHGTLVRVQFARLPVRKGRRKEPLRNERGQVRDDGLRPDRPEESLRRL
ncbi:MAG: hypothetical protein NDI90_16055 [Nitrospira sp. BO4]|nr:hypothetical protein [Nitrospira sp. BO4]